MRGMPTCTPYRVEASRSIGRAVLSSAAALTLACCAGGTLQNELPPAASIGDEPPPQAAAGQPLKQKYGSVIVRAFVRDRAVSGRVRIALAPRPIEATTGEEFQLEIGTQNLEVTLDASAGLLDRPSQRLEVFVSPHQQVQANAYFPWSRVAFTVFVQGKRQAGVPIKLLRGGLQVAELRSGAAPASLTPGKYDAQVQLHGRTIDVDRVNLLDGATQNIPLQF